MREINSEPLRLWGLRHPKMLTATAQTPSVWGGERDECSGEACVEGVWVGRGSEDRYISQKMGPCFQFDKSLSVSLVQRCADHLCGLLAES